MGRRPGHEEASRGAVVAGLASVAATVAVGVAVAQANLTDEEILAAARATSAVAIETGQRDQSIARSFESYVPDAFSAVRGIRLGDCDARSVAGARADDSGDLVCAIFRADLTSGGTAEIRFPIATTAGALVADRSLHFAGVSFGEVERQFASLTDFWSYVGNRANMLNYWPRASQVVLAEIGELEYVANERGKPMIRHRGRVLRSFRGDWVEGEAIELVTGTEGRPDIFASSDVIEPDPPRLNIAFLNVHEAGPHFLDTGWLWPYGGVLSSDLIVEDLSLVASELREQPVQ